jgi:hypothetical protein
MAVSARRLNPAAPSLPAGRLRYALKKSKLSNGFRAPARLTGYGLHKIRSKVTRKTAALGIGTGERGSDPLLAHFRDLQHEIVFSPICAISGGMSDGAR